MSNNTSDKRNRGGLIAVIIAAVILLAGISGAVFAVTRGGAENLPLVGRFFTPDTPDSDAISLGDTDGLTDEPTPIPTVEPTPAPTVTPTSIPTVEPTLEPTFVPSPAPGYVTDLPAYDDRVIQLDETESERSYLIYAPLYEGYETGYTGGTFEGGFAYTVTVPKPLYIDGGHIMIPGEFEGLDGTQNGLKLSDNAGTLVYRRRDNLTAYLYAPGNDESPREVIRQGVTSNGEFDVIINYVYSVGEEAAYICSAAADLKNGYAPHIVFYTFPGLTPEEWNDTAIFESIMKSIKPYDGGGESDFVMTYEGKRIPISDFLFSVMAADDGASDREAVTAEALKLLIETLTLARHAEEAGIVLTEREKADMLSFAAQFRLQYAKMGYDFSFITDQRIAEIMSSDTYYARLMEANTADFIIDEADFAVSLEDYKEKQKAAYYDIGLKYIAAENEAEADAALDALTSDNFDETAEAVMKRTPANVETEKAFNVPVTTLNALYNSGGVFTEETLQQILALNVGGRTGVISTAGAYYIFEVTRINIPADEELEASYREEYTALKKNESFREILDKWIEEARYSINRQAVDAVTQ